jgi:hypothetical protein
MSMIGEKEKLTLLVPNIWNKISNNNTVNDSHTTLSVIAVYVILTKLTNYPAHWCQA